MTTKSLSFAAYLAAMGYRVDKKDGKYEIEVDEELGSKLMEQFLNNKFIQKFVSYYNTLRKL